METPSIAAYDKVYGRMYLMQWANHNAVGIMDNQTPTRSEAARREMAKTHFSSGLARWWKIPELLSICEVER